jgi:hypothetical protein
LSQEQVIHYLTIAFTKSQRLERLIDELFEITRMNYGILPIKEAGQGDRSHVPLLVLIRTEKLGFALIKYEFERGWRGAIRNLEWDSVPVPPSPTA